jgi:hypothetical protein
MLKFPLYAPPLLPRFYASPAIHITRLCQVAQSISTLDLPKEASYSYT